jgi:hypothetical protein
MVRLVERQIAQKAAAALPEYLAWFEFTDW